MQAVYTPLRMTFPSLIHIGRGIIALLPLHLSLHVATLDRQLSRKDEALFEISLLLKTT